MVTATYRPPIDLDLIRAWQARADAGETKQSIARDFDLSRESVANYLRILRLPPFVLELIDAKRLAFRAARELLCFVGEDHIHLREIQWVVDKIGNVCPRSRIRDLVIEGIFHHEGEWFRFGGSTRSSS